MNRRIPLLFILTCLSAVSVLAQQPATRRLANYANNISRFTKDCPQEKVYLHFDNTGYYAGDTIWFKAYTVTADEVKPTTLSRVLHVELLTPRGEVTDSRKLKIQDGQCHGEFALPKDCKGGFYEVRAYTRAMLNFGDTHIFSRVFPVYSEPEQAGNYQEKDMDSFAGEKKERPEPEKADRVNLHFFPEGGHAVLGIPARVAFRATGKNGEDISVTGTLYNASHEPVASLATIHQGMGVFEFTPQAQEYEATVNYEGKEYTIPFKDILSEGYTMNVDNLNPDLMRISVQKSEALPNDTIAVSVTCRGKLCAIEAFVLGKEPYAFRIPKEKLPAGCIQVTAFNATGDILAERLAFNTRKDMFVPIRVTQERTVRGFTGFSGREGTEETEGSEIVYVTDHGTVYHRDLSCRYLKLSVQQAELDQVDSMRNEDGGKYYPCERCWKEGASVVFLTESGDRYHQSLNCSSLVRGIHAVRIWETGGRPPCSVCGG